MLDDRDALLNEKLSLADSVSQTFEQEPGAEKVEEENIEQDEIAGAGQYNISNAMGGRGATSVVGDNAYVVINQYVQVFREIAARETTDDEDDAGQAATKSSAQAFNEQLYVQNLGFGKQNSVFFSQPIATTNTSSSPLPKKDSDLAEWFYKLTDYQQCYVQTAAILHGASAHEVSKRTDELYSLLLQQREQSVKTFSSLHMSDQSDAQGEKASTLAGSFLHRQPGHNLRVITHTVTRRFQGVERLYWQDADKYGQSEFGLRLLVFLAGEYVNMGRHSQSLLDVLLRWASKESNECTWRSARAVGAILWYQNVDQLRATARLWAAKNTLRSRRQVASLLYGAYEIDFTHHQGAANELATTPVIQLLDEWSHFVQDKPNRTNLNKGCIVANTYGLISKQVPDIALKGVEQLLHASGNATANEADPLFAAAVSAQVTLIWSGHLHIVLRYLTQAVEQFVHTHSMRSFSRSQRDIYLNALFQTLFLIIGASSSNIQNKEAAAYVGHGLFPDQPIFPDTEGRDMILLGILTPDKIEWRDDLLSLFCAALIEKRSRPTFSILLQWAETVLSLQGTLEEKNACLSAFRQWMIDLAHTIQTWTQDLEQNGFRSPQALDTYLYRLEQWRIQRRFSPSLNTLATEVIESLRKFVK